MTVAPKEMYWHCRRGMLELDLILKNFLDKGYNDLPDSGKETFKRLLAMEDPILWRWFLAYEDPEDEQFKCLVARIKNLKV